MNWKRKLTSRKFWISVASFVAMLYLLLRNESDAMNPGLIMAGATVISYTIGEDWLIVPIHTVKEEE